MALEDSWPNQMKGAPTRPGFECLWLTRLELLKLDNKSPLLFLAIRVHWKLLKYMRLGGCAPIKTHSRGSVKFIAAKHGYKITKGFPVRYASCVMGKMLHPLHSSGFLATARKRFRSPFTKDCLIRTKERSLSEHSKKLLQCWIRQPSDLWASLLFLESSNFVWWRTEFPSISSFFWQWYPVQNLAKQEKPLWIFTYKKTSFLLL